MDAIQTFSADTLPAHFRWQMNDFARIVWGSDVTQDMDLSIYSDDCHPTYFVLAKETILLSAAAILWKMIDVQGQQYKMYGLGMVMTYPAYRKKGYGRRVVGTATQHILDQTDADMALLQTMPALEQFYARHGWEHTPSIRALSGERDNPIDEDGWLMMMFLSDRGKQARVHLEQAPFYLAEYIW